MQRILLRQGGVGYLSATAGAKNIVRTTRNPLVGPIVGHDQVFHKPLPVRSQQLDDWSTCTGASRHTNTLKTFNQWFVALADNDRPVRLRVPPIATISQTTLSSVTSERKKVRPVKHCDHKRTPNKRLRTKPTNTNHTPEADVERGLLMNKSVSPQLGHKKPLLLWSIQY
jgi:hypothetical protein